MPSTPGQLAFAVVVPILAIVATTLLFAWQARRDEVRASYGRAVAAHAARGGREAFFACPHCGTGGSLLTMSPPGGKETFPCRRCGKPIPHP